MKTTKLRFKNKQRKHSLTLKDGTVIKPEQEFEASMELIPNAFKDMVEVISVAEKPIEEKPTPNITRTIKVEEPDKEEKQPGEEEEIDKPVKDEPVKDEPVKDVKKETTYTKKHIGRGKYNVLDEAGQIVNATPLTGIKAQQLIDELTK